MQISFAPPASVEAGALVLGVFADGVLSNAAAARRARCPAR
jgi:leucyl aminopeptidase